MRFQREYAINVFVWMMTVVLLYMGIMQCISLNVAGIA